MKKINQLMVSLLALGMLSSTIVVPQNVSASHVRYARSMSNAGGLKYKIRNPSFRKQVLRNNRKAKRYLKAAYDISQYQGFLDSAKIKHLKNEIHFAILRAQADGPDIEFPHNAWLCRKYHLPYGAYSYSYYHNITSARHEAYMLHKRAPKAAFYVNDIEENDCRSRSKLDAATKAWAREMHRLTKKPVVIYSGLYFMNEHFTAKTRNLYNAIWLAAYGPRPMPNYHYDLWQKTNNHYSKALNARLDEDVFTPHSKPLSFWTGGKIAKPSKHKAKTIIVHPVKSSGTNESSNTVKTLNNNISKLKASKNMSWKSLVNNGNKAVSYMKQLNNLQKNYKSIPKNTELNLIKDSTNLINKIHKIDNLLSDKKSTSNKSIRKSNKKVGHKNRVRKPSKKPKKSLYVVDDNTARPMPVSQKHRKHSKRPRKVSYNTAKKLLRKHRNSRKGKLIRIDYTKSLKHYYISNHIHSLKVKVWRISIYSRKTHKRIGFLYKNSIIRHVTFHIAMIHNRVMTRASGSYHGLKFNTTSRKGYVKPVK